MSRFNKIGEREMYMNCAPISVAAGDAPSSHPNTQHTETMASLPNLFRANIGNGCKSDKSGTVLAIPPGNIGKTVQRIGTEIPVPPLGNCGGPVSGSDSDSVSASASALTKSSTTTKIHPNQKTTHVHTSSVATISVELSAASAVSSQSTSLSAISSSPSASSSLETGTCDIPGKSICSPDGKAWGTCDGRNRVIYRPVAAGTKCDPIMGVEVALSGKGKRWVA